MNYKEIKKETKASKGRIENLCGGRVEGAIILYNL